MSSAKDWLGLGNDSDAECNASENEDERKPRFPTKRRRVDFASAVSKNDDDGDEDEAELDGCASDDSTAKGGGEKEEAAPTDAPASAVAGDDSDAELFITNPSKIKPLTLEQLAASKAKTAKTGVVYLSRIPPFMKPSKVKDLLSRLGATGRIFLAPENPESRALRVRFGGNKKRNFEEGWVEFENRREARLAAETLNASKIGGKKGGFYYDDLWNIKYLPKFKWHHLQAQIAHENASRQARLRTEIAKETRLNKTYIRNVERSKMIENMKESKKRKRETEIKEGGGSSAAAASIEPAIEVRRVPRQNKVKGASAALKGNEEAVRKRAEEMFNSVF